MKNPELRFKNDIDDWKENKIEDLFLLSQGVQVPIENQFLIKQNNMNRFIRIIDLTQNNEPVRYIKEISNKGKVNKNDIFLVRYGAIGTIGFGYEGYIANNLFKLNNKIDLLNDFVYHLLKSPKINENIKSLNSSTTMPAINFTAFNKIQLNYPQKLTIQSQIATLLSDIDTKIETQEQKVEKLKIFKSAMLEKMFPKEGQKVPEIRFDGFSGDWEESELGKIATPHARIGWQNLRSDEFQKNGNIYLITGTDFKNGIIDFKNCYYINKFRYNQDKNIQVSNGDILITKDGTLGKIAIIKNMDLCATLNAGVFVLKDLKNINNLFLYTYLRTPNLMNYANIVMTGGTIKHLNQNVLVHFNVPLPPTLEEQEKIGKYFEELDNKIELEISKLNKLKDVKNAMLNKLLP